MFFSSIKEKYRLIRKGSPKIYLKFIIEKYWRSQNFDCLSLKNSFPGQLLGSPNSLTYEVKLFASH